MSEIEITDAMLDEIEASVARGSMLMPDRAGALIAEIRRLRAENEGITAIAKLLTDNVLAVAEASRAALEEAAIEFDRAWHEKQSITYACACVRALKDKEPAQ